MKFINRERELASLEKEYQREDSSFFVIYGRRRVGKTTLIKEFIKNKKAVYFLADSQNEIIQLNRFKDILAEQWDDNVLRHLDVNSWDGIFNYISGRIPTDDKLILVIDEFQYLARINKAVPSILQRIWDESLKNRNLMLILCGSVISMMYGTVLSYNSPLYGRRTGQMKLAPIRFKDFPKFFDSTDKKTPVELVELYAVLSGVPKYIEIFRGSDDLFTAIEENVLDRDSFLYQEPFFILNEELNETATYFSIMEVISRGEHKIGNIASRLQIPTNHLTSFLNRLVELELIEREIPVTEINPSRSKKGLYFIKDHFFRFWFRYVMPYRSYIEMENRSFVLKKLKESFHLFVSQVFEKVCMEILLTNPPVEIQKIGRWWNNREEIDIVTLSETAILLGECKWWDSKVGLNILEDLQRKSSFIETGGREQFYAIFSKNGFTKELKQLAGKEKHLFLYDISEVEQS
jgi:uncharacterized protein